MCFKKKKSKYPKVDLTFSEDQIKIAQDSIIEMVFKDNKAGISERGYIMRKESLMKIENDLGQVWIAKPL